MTDNNHIDSHHGNESHGHHHHHASAKAFAWQAISLTLLIAGVLMSHFEAGFFSGNKAVRLVWYIAAFLPVGIPVIAEAVSSIRKGEIFNEFTLMVIACIGAFCIGEYPEAVGVMLFYCVGETLQHLAVDRATHDISNLIDSRGEYATVLHDGKATRTRPHNVHIGDIIQIRPGERVALDGILTSRDAAFDTSALTGESLPRTIERGGEVLAGMISSEATVTIQVTREYEQSALARILELVKNASSRKAHAEQFIRKFARIYTPIVTGLAVLLVIVPAIVGWLHPSFHFIFSQWLYRALVFLVISCPCALVISVPLSYFAGIGAASRAGILFKGGNYLDAITRIDCVAFDKTGTLTTGNFHIKDILSPELQVDSLLALIAAAEQHSTHPIAKAIVDAANEKGLSIPNAQEMKELSGMGTEAVINDNHVIAGNARMFAKTGIPFPSKLNEEAATAVLCAIDGKYAGCILLADTVKPDAETAVKELRELGIRHISLLSGDKKSIAEECASQLGMDEAHGELLPEGKAEYVEQMATENGYNIAFVGDGFNDAPVLAVSDIGIAMGGLGSDAAIESADVVIRTDQPSKVATAIQIGRYTRKIVIQNIVGAIAIKVLILILGAFGYASLWAAVFADVGVALLAVANSMRIFWRKFRNFA